MRIQLISEPLGQAGRPPGDDIADSGAVVVLVGALMSVVFIAVAAFTIDFGNAWSTGRVLSTAADGASQAAARELHVSLTAGQTCAALVGSAGAAAQAEGEAVAAEVMGSASTEISIECTGPGHALVTATVAASSVGSFGGWHRDNYPLSRTAATIVAPAGSVRGVMGLGINCEDGERLLDALTAGEGQIIRVDIKTTHNGPCAENAGSGVWSVLNFTGSCDADAIFNLDHGEPYAIGEELVGACTGNYGPETYRLNDLLDQHLVFPILVGTVPGTTGSGTQFIVRGFLPVQLCAWRATGGQNTYRSGACDEGPSIPNLTPASNHFVALKVRPSRMIPVADVHATCGLGGAECRYAPIVVRPVA